jgi:hypothetical protein
LDAGALRDPNSGVRLWPFEGELEALLQPGFLAVAETYPAECYHHLGIGPVVKSRPESRAEAAPYLKAWAADTGTRLSKALVGMLEDGFRATRTGEDDFDALVGLLGMLDVVLGRRSPGGPSTPSRGRVEGWVLGQ